MEIILVWEYFRTFSKNSLNLIYSLKFLPILKEWKFEIMRGNREE